MEAIQTELINLVIVVITTLAGYLTTQVTSYLKKQGALTQLENNKVLVDIAVNAVEQMYKEVGGREKFEMAKHEMIEVLQSKKIKVDEKQLDLLIESAVAEMNKSRIKVINSK